MPDQPTLLDLVNQRVIGLSSWIDAHNSDKDPEARTWGRLAKVSEEAGEVISAYIGATGQNPRKGTNRTLYEVEQELCDVALTALGALAHLHGNAGAYDVLARVLNHIDAVYQRAGLPDIVGVTEKRPSATHAISWDADGTATWHCRGNLLSDCHWFPDCDCESWSRSWHVHPEAPHETCWITNWLSGMDPQDNYLGADGDDLGGTEVPKRDGEIDWDFDGDDLYWSYRDTAPA